MAVPGRVKLLTERLEHPSHTIHNAKESFESLQIAHLFELLDIEQSNFSQIPTIELKRQALQYHLVQKEFDLIGSRFVLGASAEQIKKKLELIKLAYEALLQSEEASTVTSSLSPYSQGLHQWYLRSIAPDVMPVKGKRHSINFLEAKDDGVEPGYKAFLNQAVHAVLFEKFPNDSDRQNEIEKHMGDVLSVYETYKKDISRYIVKLVHKNISADFNIEPDKDDLKRTKTILGMYELNELIGEFATAIYQKFKTAPVTEKNIEAVLEVIGNDVARVAGLQVQDQGLYPGLYDKYGILKLMLIAKWVDNATTLKPLAGTTNYQYRVNDVLAADGGIKFISNDSIKHFAQYLPLFIIQGDNDAIGSRGQNKIVVDNELIGIDFGHAYHQNIVNKVRADFSVDDKNFKNYSVFNDAPRSEIVRGLLILAKLKGERLSPKVVNSYGQEFVEKIDQIIPHSDEIIFDDYLSVFQQLKEKFSNDAAGDYNRQCCEKIIVKIRETKAKAIHEARDAFVSKFNQYLILPKMAVDLLQNMEKVMAGAKNTTLRAGDNGEVMLHHLRMLKPAIVDWDTDVNLGLYNFTATFDNVESAIAAGNTLLQYMSAHHAMLNITRVGNSLSVTFDESKLTELSLLFSENRIKHRYHPQDYALYQHYSREIELAKQMKLLQQFGFDGQLSIVAGKAGHYQITFNRNEVEVDPQFVRSLSSQFNIIEINGNSVITFPKSDLIEVIKKISAIPFEVRRENDIKANSCELTKIYDQISNLTASTDEAGGDYLKRVNANTFELSIPKDWDAILVGILNNKLSDYKGDSNQFVALYAQLTDFNALLKAAQDEYAKLRSEINLSLSALYYRHQYFHANVSNDMEVKITQVGNEFLLNLTIPQEEAILRDLFAGHHIFDGQHIQSNDLSKINLLLGDIIKKYVAIQTHIADQSNEFKQLADGLKLAHGFEVGLLNESGTFIVSIPSIDENSIFHNLFKSRFSAFHVGEFYFQFKYTDLEAMNAVFLDLAFEYGRQVQEQQIRAAYEKFNLVNQKIMRDEDLSELLKLNLSEIHDDKFALIIASNQSDIDLASILPLKKNIRGQYILTVEQLVKFTADAEVLIDAALDKKNQERQRVIDISQLHKELQALSTALNRPAYQGMFASIASGIKQAYQGETATAVSVNQSLMAYLNIDKLQTADDLSHLSQILLLRKSHVSTLCPPEKYTAEVALLTSCIALCVKLMLPFEAKEEGVSNRLTNRR